MAYIKKITGILAILALLVFGAVAVNAAEEYKVDPQHSAAVFKVGHLGIGFVWGSFPDISGTVVADAENPSESSVSITIKTESVDTNVDKRDEHLRTADFFDVQKYPTMSFKSSKVEKVDDDTVRVTGDFNLHGVTKTITVDVHKIGEGKDPWGGYRVGFETEFEIQRSEYGMAEYIPAASDKVQIKLAVEGIRQ